MNEFSLSFDDILLLPKFSTVASRKDVDVSTMVANQYLNLPIISSNMDSVTGWRMTKAMKAAGGVGCLHRFQSIGDNVKQYLESNSPWISVGMGKEELERAEALYAVGANVFVLDVANGANIYVVQQVQELKKLLHHSARIIVGNFASGQGIRDFNFHLGTEVDAYKVGIGGGSACTTRVVTGCGVPTLASLLDCAFLGVDIIADGGIRNSGDFAKAMAVSNVKAVMLGGMLAGADEAPGDLYFKDRMLHYNPTKIYSITDTTVTWQNEKGVFTTQREYGDQLKKYRGSASEESYKVQGKVADHRTAEGEAFYVPYTGPVKETLQQLEAGLRSAMSYVGASNLQLYQAKAEIIKITSNGLKENSAHGK